MNKPLFRREVIDEHRSGWLGNIALAQPLKLRVFGYAAALIVAAVILFLVLGSYTRRTRVSGQLTSVQGAAIVIAPVTGVVGKIDSKEGGRVMSGQRIALLSVPRATPVGGDVSAALARGIQQREDSLRTLERAEDDENATMRSGLQQQIMDARQERSQIDAEIATRQEQIAIARDTLERMERLRTLSLVSDLQTKQQQSIILDGEAAVLGLHREQTRLSRSMADLDQQLQSLLPRRTARFAENARKLSELERERLQTAAQAEYLVTAPISGVISSLSVKSGQTVVAGQPMMTLLPGTGALEAELLVPSRAIGFIDPGDRVLLRYDSYPYQKFGHHRGRVARISRSALTPGELDTGESRSSKAESYYRVVVRLDRQTVTVYGREEALRPGMRMEADILGERRRLIEWVFEPLFAVRGRVAAP